VRQLSLAHELQLPVIIHSRDADEDVYGLIAGSPYGGEGGGLRSLEGEVVRCNPPPSPPCEVARVLPGGTDCNGSLLSPKGVIHAFPGSAALAWRYVKLGFYLGIGGVLTYDKTGRLKSVVEAVPLDKLLVETDCPYLTPAPHRGKRNESGYLSYVADAIAGIKGISAEEVRRRTCENACVLFGL
jgi:Tat protein secretion system quality control protein TatD with DNase activity